MPSAVFRGTIGLLLLAIPAMAQPAAVGGRWKVGEQEVEFSLARDVAVYAGETTHPASGQARRLSLRFHGGSRWTLLVERRVEAPGVSGAITGQTGAPAWGEPVLVELKRGLLGGPLKGEGFRIDCPSPKPPVSSVPDLSVLAEKTVVRVLITGFDRFPRLANHPTWHGGVANPSINPSGWAVRNFDTTTLDPELLKTVEIELYRMVDVPVLYVESARMICEEAARVNADVVISFGVGADGNVDADVETECANAMDDCSDPFNPDKGPFQLPASWPPSGPESSWSETDQQWRWRYPDNAGVSYNGARIDPAAPDTLRSTLPVAKVVERAKKAGLSAIDGGGGPGRYICNNVMFKVIQTQTARGRVGGFVHLAQWSTAKQKDYLTVVRLAVEESARAFAKKEP